MVGDFAGGTDLSTVQAPTSVAAGSTGTTLRPTDAAIMAGVTSIATGDFIFG